MTAEELIGLLIDDQGKQVGTRRIVADLGRTLRRVASESVWYDMQQECDGLRVMAVLAPHLERGEDPVRLVLRGLMAMGCGVMVDPKWIDGGGG